MDRTACAAFLRQRDNYLILTHRRPDGDTIGSAAGLCLLLRQMGKTAWVLPSLDANQLVSGYLEGCVAPADYAPDTVVAVDVASQHLLPPNAEPYLGRIDLAIDHHPSHTPYASEVLVEGDRAACGVIIWELSQELGVMSPEAAAPLYAAIATDCGCFAYSNSNALTHRAAAALIEQGIPFTEINKRHFRTKTRTKLQLESLLFQQMEFYHNGTVAVATVSLALIAQSGATPEDLDDVSAFAGQIEGVRHAITIKEAEDGTGTCHISLRADTHYLNASAVCARLGGGGHAAAAGCSVQGTIAEAKAAILAALEAELPPEG